MTSQTSTHLKETTMTATAEPSPAGHHTCNPEDDVSGLSSAADHYEMVCALLDDADAPGLPLAELHGMTERVHARVAAARLAVELWPDVGEKVSAGEQAALQDNLNLSIEVSRLLPVAQAARRYLADAGVREAGAAYEALAVSVAKLDAA